MNPNPDNEKRSQRTQIAILVVALVALGGVILYQTRKTDYTRIVPKDRPVSSFDVTWRCLACGNELPGKAGRGPHKCSKCGKDEAYVSLIWTCPTHGPQKVAFQYTEGEDPDAEKVKVEDQDWVPAKTPEQSYNIRCPKCHAKLNVPMGA